MLPYCRRVAPPPGLAPPSDESLGGHTPEAGAGDDCGEVAHLESAVEQLAREAAELQHSPLFGRGSSAARNRRQTSGAEAPGCKHGPRADRPRGRRAQCGAGCDRRPPRGQETTVPRGPRSRKGSRRESALVEAPHGETFDGRVDACAASPDGVLAVSPSDGDDGHRVAQNLAVCPGRVWHTGPNAGRHDDRGGLQSENVGGGPKATAAPGVRRLGGDTWEATRRLSSRFVKKSLARTLRHARLKFGTHDVWLELFAGAESLGTALAQQTKCACIGFDIANGGQFDLTNKDTRETVATWIRQGFVRGAWLSPPCASWSVARHPAIRSLQHLYGLPHALGDPALRRVLQLGNETTRAAQSIAEICWSQHVPCVVENPASSRAWRLRRWRLLSSKDNVVSIDTDYCGFGMPWRKHAKLLCVHVSAAYALRRRCVGHGGRCSFTGQRRVQLRGGDRTKQAQLYPAALCRVAARTLGRTADQCGLVRLYRAAEGNFSGDIRPGCQYGVIREARSSRQSRRSS